MYNNKLHEFLVKESKINRKISINKSDKDSTDDFENTEIKVESKYILDKKYKTEICKNFMKNNYC